MVAVFVFDQELRTGEVGLMTALEATVRSARAFLTSRAVA
jgi:abortive infection bacteriophage resistance protein